MNGITLFEFQETCSTELIKFCLMKDRATMIVKSPTGSGKTIILLNFIDKYLNIHPQKTCFIWLTPGSGDLEEQSKKKMDKYLSNRKSKTLDDVLNEGFNDEDVCFINWERVTKKGNVSIRESERKNLFEAISEAHRSQIQFILIIDEEHSHNTGKAQHIIDAFAPKNTIRVSATAQRNRSYDYYEIDESKVINSGLITKSLYINEGIRQSIDDQNIYSDEEHKILIDLALKKRKNIERQYKTINENINPLIIIQFPNENDELIALIEEILNGYGINYDNKLLAIRMDNNHVNFEGIEENDNITQVLLIKQAVATGWDCPRAKILVKLRENMNEQFEIQTLGRIRRMPNARHYDNPLLDNAYLYTFDDKYTEGVKQSIESSFFVKRIFLKPEFREFKLTKQLRNLDNQGIGERETFNIIYDYLCEKYDLSDIYEDNKEHLKTKNYVFQREISQKVVEDVINLTSDLNTENLSTFEVNHVVNTKTHGFPLMTATNQIKSVIGMNYDQTKIILERLFRNNNRHSQKIVSLSTDDYYAFIINNKDLIKDDLKEALSNFAQQRTFVVEPKTEDFTFPETDLLKISKRQTYIETLTKNNYNDYTDDCLVEGIRSKPERLFERFCQNNPKIEWYYKNGDSGRDYFSIVYFDELKNQHLFFADYILKTTDDKIWIIETKGGEHEDGTSKNIDENVKHKFIAFRDYAEKYELNWGFVRDLNEKLLINNTEYVDDLNDTHWKLLDQVFS